MRRYVIATAVLFGALTVPAAALGPAARIVTTPGAATAGYATRIAPHGIGTQAKYTNLDIVAHDVRSVATRNGVPLFKSALIGVGKTTPVLGTERLAKGTYQFFCTLHPNMKGQLQVR